MLGYLSTGWFRWLAVPLAFAAIALASVGTGLLALGCLLATAVVGYVDQSVRLGTMPARRRWPTVVVVALAVVVLVPVEFVWIPHDTSLLDYVTFLLAGLAGIMTGTFVASLRWFRNPRSYVADLLGSTEPMTVADVLAKANELTDFRPVEASRAYVALPEPRAVEAFVDGDWRPARLVAWDTRKLGLVGRVTFRDGDTDVEDWISADLIRAVGGPETRGGSGA